MSAVRRGFALFLAALLFLSTSGCFAGSIEELYTLPAPANEYLQLQALIDAEIALGNEYAAPASGSYRQPVQLYDLDGDGTDEALAFFRGPDQNLKICLFDVTDGDYENILTITGEGSSIGSVEYADFNQDGVSELSVAWQISTGLRMLKVYSLVGWGGDQILTADCTEFLVDDLNNDGRTELLNIRFDSSEGGFVDMYSFSDENAAESSSARFSTGIYSLERVRTGFLAKNLPVLLVESEYQEGWLVTDLFVCRRGRLLNLSQDRATGISNTLRQYNVLCSDIDGDHYIEVPMPVPLFVQPDSGSYYAFDWYSYDANGERTLDASTYHCYLDGWYLILRPRWRATLTVRREDGISGERTVVLSTVEPDTGTVNDFLVVYTLTGENRHERAQTSGRFLLMEEGSTVYAARILPGAGIDVTQNLVKDNFMLIYTEWMTGSI
jgi:hypothetical protein